MNQRASKRGLRLAVAFTLALLGVAGVVMWRAIQGPGVETRRVPRQDAVDEAAELPEGAEALSAEERRILEDVLRRKGAERGQ